MADFARDEAEIGYGKELSYSDTSNGTFVKVAGSVEVETPDVELEAVEVTNDDSADGHKDYIPGLYEPGTLPFSYRYTKTAFTAIDTIFLLATDTATRDSATKFWKLTFPDGSTMAWRGFLTKHGLPLPIDDVLRRTPARSAQ